MPLKNCPYCGGVYSALSENTESCRSPKCVKANQRAKKRLAAGVVEVKRGRPKSHVVLLKQRVKERILGKAEGPSTTPCASSDASDSDVPPVFVKRTFIPVVDGEPTPSERRDMLREILADDPEDATAGLPPEALPEAKRRIDWPSILTKEQIQSVIATITPKQAQVSFTQLPIEDSTAINQQAKAVISKVPTCKPGSELARLEKSQLKGKKKE